MLQTTVDFTSPQHKYSWQGLWHIWKALPVQYARRGSWADTFVEWEDYCLNLSSYPTGENLSQVLCASLCRGLGCDDLDTRTRNLSEDMRKMLGAVKIVRWCIFPLRFCFPFMFMICLGIALALSIFLHGDGLSGDFNSFFWCDGYRLAKTRNGYVSMAPRSTQIGDRIALLPGGKTPYIVRAQQLQWQLIGECYAHGIMFGEGWSEEACGPMQFI
jgi:hypothetical protein